MKLRLLAAGPVLLASSHAFAQGNSPPSSSRPADEQQTPKEPPDQTTFTDQVVVSASRSEEQLVNAPAAVSVVTSETIQNSPGTNMGDLLRAVPGLNITQVSARDVNMTSR